MRNGQADRPRHRSRRSGVWRLYLALHLTALVLYLFLPAGLALDVCFQVVAWTGVAMMVGRLLRCRSAGVGALWLLAAFQAGTAVGVLVMYVFAPHGHGPQDIVFLASYIPAIAGMVQLTRRRIPARNRELLLDAAIVSSGFALLTCVFLIKPAIATAGSAPVAALACAYPVADLFLLVLLVSLLLGGGLGNPSMRLVALGQLATVVADCGIAFLPMDLLRYPPLSNAPTGMYLLAYGLYGASALHPDFTRLAVASPPTARAERSWSRMSLLWGAVVTGPALLALEAWWHRLKVPDAYAIAVGCIVIFTLVVGRLQLLLGRINSQSVVLAEQAEQLRVLASYDGLTGLVNRRTWDTMLDEFLEQARRHGHGITVALIDLDLFKRYNDQLGHQAGDRLLKAAAAAWTAQLRTVDVLARYGGEEFVALLPGCDAEEATQVMRRCRDVTPDGQSFSAGIATWDREETGEDLLARADKALYEAKWAGRGRSAVAAPARDAASVMPSRG